MAQYIFDVLGLVKNAVLIDRLVKRDFRGVIGCSIAGLAISLIEITMLITKIMIVDRMPVIFLAIISVYTVQEIILSCYLIYWSRYGRSEEGRVYGLVSASLLTLQHLIPTTLGMMISAKARMLPFNYTNIDIKNIAEGEV